MKPAWIPIIGLAISACGSSSPPAAQPQSPPAGHLAPASPTSQPPVARALHSVYLEDLDRKADPCTDFFEFANGAWRAANPIPAWMDRWSRRWKAGDDAKEQLKNILDEVAARTDWPKSSVEQQIGDFYAGCMDQARVDQLGIEPIAPLLDGIAAIRDRAGLQQMIARLSELGVAAPFQFVGGSDPHAPENQIAIVFAGGLGMPDRDYYLKREPRFAEARKQYAKFAAAMFTLAKYTPAAAKAGAAAVIALETKLARARLDNVALRDPHAVDHPMTVAQLQRITPSFNWTAYLSAGRVAPAPLNVTEPKFFAEVERQFKQTSLADWKTYLAWHLLLAAADSLGQPFVDESFAFYGKHIEGRQELPPRWKRCATQTDALLGEALGKKYVEKYFPPAAKARMKTLVDDLLAAMRGTIEQLDWMGPETRAKALEKLGTFRMKIGYPDKWKDYSSIPIQRADHWANVAGARAWNIADDRATIGKPVDRERWLMTPPTSNAYYDASLNEIVFPAGILQPPAFSLDAVDAVNYGAIGVVIGHEISHGFDDQGAQYDAQGRLKNWWTADDLKKFKARGQCVVAQYEQYFIEPGIHHNGKLVLGESIGDLGGANLAYRAYQKALQRTPATTRDGFTPNQQFFIAWGQFRGDATRPETQRQMIQGDPHPVAKYRVIGALANMPEFQSAFSCKADAPMVRPAAQRCVVW